MKGVILFDTRWFVTLGIGRFGREIFNRLPNVVEIKSPLGRLNPLDPLLLGWQLSRSQPSAYFSPGFNPPLWSQVPFVFTIHDMIHLRYSEETGVSKRFYYETIVKRGVRNAAAVLTVSEYSRQEIANWARISEDRIIVVRNGVDPSFTPEGETHTPGYSYLFYVGDNERPHKNVKAMLTAYARTGLAPDVHFALTGKAHPRLMEHIRALGLAPYVHFTGFLSDEELPSYYRGAEALVLASHYEGFGIPIIEAMASGTPVLTSSVTAMPEIAGDAAAYVNPTDTDSIAAGMLSIVNDGTLRSELRAKGLERAKLFSWDTTAEKVRLVLEEAAKG